MNIKNKQELTPLHLAVSENDYYMAELLLEYGADIKAKDKKGISPVDIANTKEYEDISKLLSKTNKKEKKKR